jgi:tetratricopeptide (TPR) repeat protein
MVRLREGGITLEVSPLRSGERFRVIVGDAEIEVKGTEFQVIAENDRLVSVRVFHGRVEVRPMGRPSQTLLPGQEWDANAEARPLFVPAMPKPTLLPKHLSYRRPSSPPLPAEASRPETAEESFDEAWRLLRKSDFKGAISALDRTLILADKSPIAEDASFWSAVCHAKTHDDRKARTGFESFLQTFPSSPRAGEASAMLGWTLIRLGDLRQARFRFSTAEHDASARVRDSARLGMAALEHEVRASSSNLP